MSTCDDTGRTDVEMEPGPTEWTVRCPACGAVLMEDTLLPPDPE